jgi:hypothetical protein
MNRTNKIKQYKEIESALERRYRNKRENEVSLDKSDFKDGKLSVSGYTWLKQQCEYIDHRHNIEISVPKEYAENFMDTLEYLAANELSCIKKDTRNVKGKSLIL